MLSIDGDRGQTSPKAEGALGSSTWKGNGKEPVTVDEEVTGTQRHHQKSRTEDGSSLMENLVQTSLFEQDSELLH